MTEEQRKAKTFLDRYKRASTEGEAAELYEEIQDNDSAKKYYFRVLEQEPNNEKAKKKIQELSSNTIN